MKTATDRSWSGILQLMALAEALKTYCSVVSVYPAVSYHFRPILNGRIFTSDNSDNNTHILHVLWSRDLITPLVLCINQITLFLFSHKIHLKERGLKKKNWNMCPKRKRNSCQSCRFFNQNKINYKKRKDQ